MKEAVECVLEKISDFAKEVGDIPDDALKDLRLIGFMLSLKEMQKEVHETAKSKGWHDTKREDGTLLALIHGEVSEVMEALLRGNPKDEKFPEYTEAEVEMAGIIIRCLDMCEANGWDVAGAILAKAEYNKGRGYKHGGKAF